MTLNGTQHFSFGKMMNIAMSIIQITLSIRSFSFLRVKHNLPMVLEVQDMYP